MKQQLSARELLAQIKQLQKNGESLHIEEVKYSHPKLLEQALAYYPTWEDAVKMTAMESGLNLHAND
ncbi:hypothetical protein LSG31_19160 [Fodinisporobacter ferrooxydans]|uniref:Uncharacterized protein n=1 Tax=Fodinisporobacter ferrooxydans TaxID=2901836 RepID=A0ABY4CL35_9BACL|nr:hypothetical protein LSG31_19160 [Alicyclobacillaceae bacterium MYW30-H2]